MAVSQQQESQSTSLRSNPGGDQAKSRKRKGNKQQNNGKNNSSVQNQPSKIVETSKQENIDQNPKLCKDNLPSDKHVSSDSKGELKLINDTTARKTNPVIASVGQPPVDAKKETKVPKKSINDVGTVQVTSISKRICADEPDDIDAGIELDGSSNSGSSVKDNSEDQAKSASVSPVMAQSNLLSEDRSATKHAIELGPVEQMVSSVSTDLSLSAKKSATPTKKQQLAENQQVIDADEQQLQQKLQIKQRKSSLAGSINTSAANSSKITQNNLSPQSPSLCKICDQHVYQMERVMAEKSIYHKGCFRCYQCKVQLRMDNYSSHEGQVYCKAHHRQIFQPQVKLDSADDVDIVAKSSKYNDD